ncbi:YopX family protein [Bacillus cereus group sp. BY142LC]|uniref:YopX family protein n=1 Tax=Bacillus cereus group sp. BY142LC TaxID=3018083 RepID=UPI0022E2B1AE|nr:YopX family protein [Bacillus cereus group sp. BY142LC]MDA1834817.1 YopX family protein [Bacillus cereus group sp. BY142LC]
MNEIKYRIYGKENRIMYSWEEILNFDSLKDTLKNGGKEDQYYSPLLQYTGLKDKNGTEIYIGDIVKVVGHPFDRSIDVDGNYEIGYNEVMEISCGGWYLHRMRHWAEVIGNIYESPELLEN